MPTAAAGPYTPIVTALDQDHRSSGLATVASPIVVSPLDPNVVSVVLTNPTVIIDVANLSEAEIALQTINGAPPTAWSTNLDNPTVVHLNVTSPVVFDTEIDPTSADAQVDVSGPDSGLLGITQYVSVTNPYASGGSQTLTQVAFISAIVATAIIGGAATGDVAGNAATDWEDFLTEWVDVDPETLETTTSVGLQPNATGASGIADNVVAVGAGTGALSGTQTLQTLAGYSNYAVGVSPAVTVVQGTVTWSNSLMGTATDALTIVVRGGTLIPMDDFVSGNFAGSQALIEVDGGTLILGAPDDTHSNILATDGSAPFVHVAGMLIVEPGNAFNRVTFDPSTSTLTSQAAGLTVTQLVSSAPAALPGRAVTLTATVTTAGGARQRRHGRILRPHERHIPGHRPGIAGRLVARGGDGPGRRVGGARLVAPRELRGVDRTGRQPHRGPTTKDRGSRHGKLEGADVTTGREGLGRAGRRSSRPR